MVNAWKSRQLNRQWTGDNGQSSALGENVSNHIRQVPIYKKKCVHVYKKQQYLRKKTVIVYTHTKEELIKNKYKMYK